MPCVPGSPADGCKCGRIWLNQWTNRNKRSWHDATIARRVICVPFFFSFLLTLQFPLVNGFFFSSNCLIVFVKQAGGSKPHLASGRKKKTQNKTKKKKKKPHCISISTERESVGRVAGVFHSQSSPPVSPSLGRDQKQVCAVTLFNVYRWIKHLPVRLPLQVISQRAVPLTTGKCYHRERTVLLSV